MDLKTEIREYFYKIHGSHIETDIANIIAIAEKHIALQLQQAGVKQSVFYSIVDNGTVLEKFKEKETAKNALKDYKRNGFPYAKISKTVA